MKLNRRAALAALGSLAAPLWAADSVAQWASSARGQTVYFNAWAGSEAINAYIQWAAQQAFAQWGFKV